MRMLHSLHTDNPLYYTSLGALTDLGIDYIQGKLGKLTGVRRLRLLKGQWAAAEGIIYEEWSESTNVIPNFVRPKDLSNWQFWWAVDFGFINPFCWQMWAEDPDGKLFLVREIYKTKTLVEDHARKIMEIMRTEEWPYPVAVICDHDAEDRATLERHIHMATAPANKKVIGGIQLVQARIREDRLVICEDALVEKDSELVESNKPTCTLEEFPAYVWANKGRRTDDGELKDEPLKEKDHGMDAARYIVARRDWGMNGSVRFM